MVAYNFNPRFALAVVHGAKRQTIRAPRKRHARLGERLQLYTGMRTRTCRLLRDDVFCTRLDEVRFDLRPLAGVVMPDTAVALAIAIAQAEPALAVNGIPIEAVDEQDAFAARDGFDGWFLDGRERLTPFEAMVLFWMGTHGAGLFEGVMISWEVAP